MTIALQYDTSTVDVLTAAFADHKVRVKYSHSVHGPTVTQHAFALEAGTKLRAVTALGKDLALAVGLDELRIIAPIPGTSLIGIEVPAAERETVTYEDFVSDTDAYEPREAGHALPIPIGVGIDNVPIWVDLAATPHLAIAGTTGSGKSVALTSALASLIDLKSPDELRLWLIDPKRVELSAFADAPHVERIATDTADAVEILESVADIMDQRYASFEYDNVRNIGEYNALCETRRDIEPIPYHVVVIDELADLMMTSGKVAEPLIVRITQLARAAGIHMILATQRPTVDVLKGTIKNNVPARWAFSVPSAVDSKVILDASGAEALYGKGDSLFLMGGGKAVRAQAVYTDAATVAQLVHDGQASADSYGFRPSGEGQRANGGEADVTESEMGLDDVGDGPADWKPMFHAHAITVTDGEVCPTGIEYCTYPHPETYARPHLLDSAEITPFVEQVNRTAHNMAAAMESGSLPACPVAEPVIQPGKHADHPGDETEAMQLIEEIVEARVEAALKTRRQRFIGVVFGAAFTAAAATAAVFAAKDWIAGW